MNDNKLVFNPHFLVRNKHFQTIASSLVKKKESIVQQNAKEMILDAELRSVCSSIVLFLTSWMTH